MPDLSGKTVFSFCDDPKFIKIILFMMDNLYLVNARIKETGDVTLDDIIQSGDLEYFERKMIENVPKQHTFNPYFVKKNKAFDEFLD